MRSQQFWLVLALFLLTLQPARKVWAQAVVTELYGRVFDDANGNGFDDNEPCVNSLISLTPVRGRSQPRMARVLCTETPYFFFSEVVPGDYILSVVQTDPADFVLPSLMITIPSGAPARTEQDIPLRRLLQEISGTVALDKNGNRQLDPGEPPVAGVGIDLLDATHNTLIAHTSTDSSGQFNFTVKPPGDYVIAAHDPTGTIATAAVPGSSGHASVQDASHLQVTLDAGQSAQSLLFLIRSTAGRSIAGHAYLDTDGDGILNTGDAPLPNLEVRLLDTAGNLVADTRTLDDGSYFFDAPPTGRAYLVTTVPTFGLAPQLAVAGAGGAAVGSDAILIANYQSGTLFAGNDFLLSNRASGVPPLPSGPASLEGYVVAQVPTSRVPLPLAGVTVQLHDAAGTVRAEGQTNVGGSFLFQKLPIGNYTLTKIDPPGYVAADVVPGQNATRVDVNTISVHMFAGLNTYAGSEFIDRPSGQPVVLNSIEGSVSLNDGTQVRPLTNLIVVLQNGAKVLAGVATTNASGQYRFAQLPTGTYRVAAALAPGNASGDATPGPHATKIDAQTIQISMAAGVTDYPGNNFLQILSGAGAVKVVRVIGIGDSIAATGRLGLFGSDPVDQDQNVSAIRRVLSDGSLLVSDYAGSSLLQIGSGGAQVTAASAHVLQASSSQVLLDTSARDPKDSVGLARILRVETSPSGVSAILALRADNTLGFYQLQNGALTRLALQPDLNGPRELAIGDAGQIAYVAPDANGALALFQTSVSGTTAGRSVELLRAGQVVVNGASINGFTNLTSNAGGDLAILLQLRQGNGAPAQAIVRKTSSGLALVALTGLQVAVDRSGTRLGTFSALRRPRMGPEQSIVFQGSGDGFTNFYVVSLNRLLQPMLDGTDWKTPDDTFDHEIGADGSVALRATPGASSSAGLYLVGRNGSVMVVQKPGDTIQPAGRPVFGPDGTESLFYFLARNVARPLDRNGRVPVVLCRSRIMNGAPVVDGVAVPGEPMPGKPGAQLLTITQRPVVTANGVIFGVLYGSSGNFPVPGGALLRLPLGGALADATIVADEAVTLPAAGRLAILRDLAFTPEGSLVFSGLMPGAGSLVATAPAAPSNQASRPRITSAARIQATPPPAVTPLLAIGQPLDRPNRLLLSVAGRLVALGSNRQLLVARFSQPDGSVGEGLFSVARDGTVQAIAASGDPAPGLTSTRFAGFADTTAYTLSPPAVSTDGSVVFKARLDQNGTAADGVFKWNGSTLALVGISDPNPDNLALSPADHAPYSLERWAAGPGGSAYLMEQHVTLAAAEVTRLFVFSTSVLAPLVNPGVTPVVGAGSLSALVDYTLNSAGTVFVQGGAGGKSALFSMGRAGLTPVATQGQPLPPPADGTDVQGLVFGGSFTLMPDSERGNLLFRAGVTTNGIPESGQQGLFRLDSGGVTTLMVENLAVGGARDLTFGTLGSSPDRQTISGISAFATQSNGLWTIFRWKAGKTTVVAQEGQPLPGGGPKIAALDAGPLLNQPGLPPQSGPIFTLNDNGDVAFMASDGTRWGIYLFSSP